MTGREEYASIAKGGCAPFFFSVRRFRSYRHYAKLRLAKLLYGLHNDETRYFIGKIYLVLLFGRLTNRYCTVQIVTGTVPGREEISIKDGVEPLRVIRIM